MNRKVSTEKCPFCHYSPGSFVMEMKANTRSGDISNFQDPRGFLKAEGPSPTSLRAMLNPVTGLGIWLPR